MRLGLGFPTMREFIQQDYVYIKSEEALPRIRTNIVRDGEITDRSPVFTEIRKQPVYLPAAIVQNSPQTDPLPWRPAFAMNEHVPLTDIVSALQGADMILVTNGKKPIGYLSASSFISRLVQSYRYLEAFFETVIQTLDASVSAVDEEGKTVIWSSGAEQLFSIRQEEIISKPMSAFFPSEMIQVLKTLKTGEAIQRGQHRPQPDRVVLINVNPVRIQDRIIGAVASEVDITSQIRLNHELFHMSSKVQRLEQDIARLTPGKDPFDAIKGKSKSLRNMMETIRKLEKTEATVLLLGESGVGKELFARAVHDVREQSSAPFVAINCAAIPSPLFESELFGYEKGAFSGADQRGKKGKIEFARGGTLFLDEIGEMPLETQAKLLRVLQERNYYPVGGGELKTADCRIIAATNRNPLAMVKEGKFREDLYYRLNVITLEIPPLRERRDDVLELIHSFLPEFSTRYNRFIEQLPYDVMEALLQYDWPGNVRELRNTVERLVVLASDGKIKAEDLPQAISQGVKPAFVPEFSASDVQHSLSDERKAMEMDLIVKALALENGNRKAAALRLGISRATLYNKLNKFGIDREN